MRHRIVQYQGRRYSIRMDNLVWLRLEEISQNQGIRLNQLIGQIAGGVVDETSLTGALRNFCLRQTIEQLQRAEQQLTEMENVVQGLPIGSFVEACPAPAILVDRTKTVARINRPALQWLGLAERDILGHGIEEYLQIRCAIDLDKILENLDKGKITTHLGRVIYVRPGRVVTAKASVCPGRIDREAGSSCVIMVDPGIAGQVH